MFWEKGKKSILEKIKADGLDGYLISEKSAIQYLTGFYFAGCLLLILADGDLVLFLSRMDSHFAGEEIAKKKIEVSEVQKSWLDAVKSYICKEGILRVGINDDISLGFFRELKKSLPEVELFSFASSSGVDSFIRDLRIVKSEKEVELLRDLAERTKGLVEDVSAIVKEGITDWQIIACLDAKIRQQGGTNSFGTIAAIDEDSANPHALPTGRSLSANSHLLLDFGMKRDGYCSDLTRTICTGRINRQIRSFYDTVRRAQDQIFQNIKPGRSISEIMKRAKTVISEAGFSDNLLHGFGHGIGVEVHEKPFLNTEQQLEFIENMVIAVEPGLYKRGLGGVREEDMVLVTSNGCEVLTR